MKRVLKIISQYIIENDWILKSLAFIIFTLLGLIMFRLKVELIRLIV